MFKFDYRQFEPEPRDLDERARVRWLPFIEAELVNRYRSTDGRGQEIIGHSLLLNSCTAYWGFLMSMIPKSRARSLSNSATGFSALSIQIVGGLVRRCPASLSPTSGRRLI